MTKSPWTERLHDACDTVVWMVKLNLWWMAATAVGLVVIGIAPATTAAAIMVRRRADDQPHRLGDFVATYRAELVRSQPVILPVVAVLGLLGGNYQWFSLLGPAANTPRLLTLAALILGVGVAAYVAPLYAYYQLPRHRYAVQAVRIALARPLWTVLLVFVAVTLTFVSARWPVLVPLIAVGTWLQTSGWLCLKFFAGNEDRLAAPQVGAPDHQLVLALPHDPVRMH